jgi:O-antigen ligase
LVLVLGGVMLQYVWRVQELFPVLRFVQFTALVSGGAVLLFVCDPLGLTRLPRLKHRLYRSVLVILALAILSVPTSVHAKASVQFLTGNFMKTVLLVGILVAAVRDRRDLDRLLRLFVFGGVVYLVAAMAFARPGAGRLGGGSYDPNDLGLFTVSTVPLCIYFMRRGGPRLEKVLGLVASVVLLIGTVLSGSRGGFLALVGVVTYSLFGLSAVKKSKRLAVLTIGVGIMFGAAGEQYWTRMHTILVPQEDYNWAGQAESGRVEVWKRGLSYMARRPLLGVGVDQFTIAEGTMAPQAQRQEYGIGWRWSAPHNSYVQIGAEVGVFALATFVLMLWFAFREAREIGRRATTREDRLLGQAFAGVFVGYALGCAFLTQAYATYLYFALGLLIAFSCVASRGDARVDQPGIPMIPRLSRGGVRHQAAVPVGRGGLRCRAR